MHVQKLNYKKHIYELDDHVGERTLSLDLLLKFKHAKKTPTSFPNCLLKWHAWIKSMFPYVLLPHHKKGKMKHHWGNKKSKCQATTKMGLMLSYLMANEMLVAHHATNNKDVVVQSNMTKA